MNRSLVHAIVGCGRVAPAHVDAFSRIPGTRLKYAVASNARNASAFAAKYGIERSTNSFTEVLDDPEVDSLSIATPHFLHTQMALEALERGKHLLIEKPFAMTPGEGEQIRNAAKKNSSRVVFPVSQHRFDPAVREIARLTQAGMLGTVLLCRAHLECFRPADYYTESDWRGAWETEGGSVLINQAYHIMDLMLWLCGPVERLSAFMQTRRYCKVIDTEETLVANWIFCDGAAGSITVCGAAGSSWNTYIEILGTNGVVAFDVGYPNRVHRLQLEDRRELLLAKKTLKDIGSKHELPPPALLYYGTSHRGQASAFAENIRSEAIDPFACDISHALETVRTIDAIYRSAKSGASISLHSHAQG